MTTRSTYPCTADAFATPRAALIRVRFLDAGADATVLAECAAGDAAAIEAGSLWDWADELVTKAHHRDPPWNGRTKIAFELHFEGMDVYQGSIDIWPSQCTTKYRGRRSHVWPLSLHVRHHCLSIGRGACPQFLAPDTFRAFLAQYTAPERAAFLRYLDEADLGGEHPMPWKYAEV